MLPSNNRIEYFEKIHQDAMASIKEYQNSSEPEMQAITNYLLETNEEPCTFLPSVWVSAFSSSGEFAGLLHIIHHTLYDDGDISFPIVNGEPRIAFMNKDEENYEDYILEYVLQEKEKEQLRKGLMVIGYCIDVMDFIARHKEYHRNKVQHFYIQDAARYGWSFADSHYKQYSNFDPSWKSDSSVISKVQKIRKSLCIGA